MRSSWACSLGLLLLLIACSKPAAVDPPAKSDRPVVLVTLAGLRADAVGPRTPNLRKLRRVADWSGHSIAASGDPSAALASLLRGLSPWQLRDSHIDQPTLVEIFQESGYQARVFAPAYFRQPPLDLGQGVEAWKPPPKSPSRAAAIVATLQDREFLWIHLPHAELTYGNRRRPKSQQSGRLRPGQLLRYADPARRLPPGERRKILASYREGVALVDRYLGQILGELRRNPLWDEMIFVVAATHGTEIGEAKQILSGWNLSRPVIETPLWLKIPGVQFQETSQRVAATRVWPTLVEGFAPTAPHHLPSLSFKSHEPILSELYGINGANLFSLLHQDLQLLWEARFFESAPAYYKARRAVRTRVQGEMRLGAAQRLLKRLDKAFGDALPLAGDTDPSIRLVRWLPDSTVEPIEDPALLQEGGTRLRRQWMRFTDREQKPAAQAP